jgi:hypothetical protein
MFESSFSASQYFVQNSPQDKGAVTMSIIVVGVLLALSLSVVIHVLFISREREFSFRSAMGSALSVVWAVPVFAILAVFVYQAQGHFREPGRKQSQQVSEGETSSPQVKPEFEVVDPLPSWVNETSETVITARGATVAEAETKLAQQTRRKLAKIANSGSENQKQLYRLASRADQTYLRAHAVDRRFEQRGIERIHVARPGKSKKEYANQVVQVYWELDLSPAMCEQLRQQASVPRIWLLGGFFGLLALIAFGASTYFRLDTRTAGKYRTRLKLATTSLIVAGGLLIIAFLPAI